MSATLDFLVKQAAIVLNASTGTGAGDSSTIGAIDDPKKFPYAFLSNAALDADAEVCGLACLTQDHPWQKDFITVTGALADEAVVAPASGGGRVYAILNVEVDGVDARRKPFTYFKRLLTDPLSRTTIGKYYDIQGNSIIRHNGTTAILRVVRFAKGAAPQAPDEANNATISCLLSMVTPKMGVDHQAAGYFAQQWAMRAQMIASGKVEIPPVISWQQMERAS